MARSKLKYGVNASTILEVVISMVVIVIVFGVAMMIFTNVTRLSLSAKKIRAQALLQKISFEIEQNPENVKEAYVVDDFVITTQLTAYNNDNNLEVHLTAFDQNQQKIAEMQKIIVNQP